MQCRPGVITEVLGLVEILGRMETVAQLGVVGAGWHWQLWYLFLQWLMAGGRL
jgi:hypothetical protein